MPSRGMRLEGWKGAGDPLLVAPAGHVLDTLAAIATMLAQQSLRDLDWVRRLLGTSLPE